MSVKLLNASPTFATVEVSSALALAANDNRRYAILINTSANTISLAFGANAAVLNSGITISAGSSYEITELNLTLEAINAIASAGSSNLAIQEAGQ